MRNDIFVSLRTLRSLDLIFREGSFDEAGAHLNITTDALFKQIIEFEKRLGIKIFKDKRKSTELTTEGRTLVHSVSESFGAINRALQEVTVQSTKVSLRLPQTIALEWVIPALKEADLLDKLTLIVDPNYEFRSPDIEIRYFPEETLTKQGVTLLDDISIPIISSSLLMSKEGLESHAEKFGIISGTHDCWDWRRYLSQAGFPDDFLLNAQMHIADTDLTAIEMASAGIGVALAQEILFSRLANTRKIEKLPNCSFHKIGEYRLIANTEKTEIQKFISFLSGLHRMRPVMSAERPKLAGI